MRSLTILFVSLCFFLSMFITNDVALITFVPFTLLIFDKIGRHEKLISVVVLETIAANLGSMMTPVGNPQNLYLYGLSGYSPIQFVAHMAPVTCVSFLMLMASSVLVKSEKITIADQGKSSFDRKPSLTIYYFILFVFCLLAVAYVIPYLVLLVNIPVLLLADRNTLKKVDYCLLFTFISFFVFIGNMQRIPIISNWISSLVSGRELIVSFLCSQVISNVPAAILLSGFTQNYDKLLLGVNIGGLGTLIASLASLISFKYFSNYAEKLPKESGITKGRYLIHFTLMNVLFAVALLLIVFIQ